MPMDSKDSAIQSAPDQSSFTLDYDTSPFVFKRRSYASAAFAEIHERFQSKVQQESEMERAFTGFMENLRGVVLTQADAERLDALVRRGADDLGIEVGSLPPAIGPGLTLMYDATIETLRSSDRPIEPKSIDERVIRIIDQSLDGVLPLIGSSSVTALELALDYDDYGDRLRDRSTEVETYLQPLPPSLEPCEHCELIITDSDGRVVNRRCGSEAECDVLGGFVIVGISVWLISELWDWLF